MSNPIVWLCLSFLLVSVSLTAVFVVLVPAVVELSRAARSFEKLCETLDRDLPPTLESLRQTTAEIARLTDDVNTGVQSAGRVAQQVDQSVSTVRTQAKRAQVSTRSLMAGMGAAWATFTQPADEGGDRPRPAPPPGQPSPRNHSTATAVPPRSPVDQSASHAAAPPAAREESASAMNAQAKPATLTPNNVAQDSIVIAPHQAGEAKTDIDSADQ